MIIEKIKRPNGYSAIVRCDECGKDRRMPYFHATRSIKHFCNYKCYAKHFRSGKMPYKNRGHSLAKMGAKNPMFGKHPTRLQKIELAVKIFNRMPKTVRGLRGAADKLWSRIVRSIGHCEVCGKTEFLNPHHIIGRNNMITRLDLRNGICLCAGCHMFKRLSAHQDPLWFADWLKEHKPETVEYLKTKRYKLKQWTVPELEIVVAELREKDPTYGT